MNNTPNVYLIGPMGSGKTAIGKKLANALGYDFYDSDLEIINKTGVTIEHIFDVEGEAGFRKREEQMIAELTGLNSIVLSTGGGVILSEVNRKKLIENGLVVYLSATIEVLVERVAKNNQQNRPLLGQYDNVTEALTNILTEREPLYQNCADAVISTQNIGIERIVKRITRVMDNIAKSRGVSS